MNYHKITKTDVANGSGIRVVLWVSGCEHHCTGCHNPQTWDEKSGKPFDDSAKSEMLAALNKSYIAGLTFSGGDPLHPNNVKTVTMLAQEVKEKFPDKNIWLYTGYEWEEIKDYAIMKYIDIVVEGEFIQEQRNISLKWCGSSNQRIVNVRKSIENDTVVLWE